MDKTSVANPIDRHVLKKRETSHEMIDQFTEKVESIVDRNQHALENCGHALDEITRKIDIILTRSPNDQNPENTKKETRDNFITEMEKIFYVNIENIMRPAVKAEMLFERLKTINERIRI